MHRILHMDDSPHKCPTCGRSFNQRSNLKTHLLTHTDIKPYNCSDCGKEFRRNCDLRRHMLTHTLGLSGDQLAKMSPVESNNPTRGRPPLHSNRIHYNHMHSYNHSKHYMVANNGTERKSKSTNGADDDGGSDGSRNSPNSKVEINGAQREADNLKNGDIGDGEDVDDEDDGPVNMTDSDNEEIHEISEEDDDDEEEEDEEEVIGIEDDNVDIEEDIDVEN